MLWKGNESAIICFVQSSFSAFFFFDETGTLEISPKCEKCVLLVFSRELVMSEPKNKRFVTHFWAVRISILRELFILVILFSGFGTEARQQLI